MHVEFQGDTSRKSEFAERMYEYFTRIRWKHPGKPVSAVAIFMGQDGKTMPTRYVYTYRKTRLVYKYHSFSILDFTDEELEASDNPFAVVVLAVIAKQLFRKGFTNPKVRAIFTFLENYVLFEDPEMNRTFREQIKSSDKNNAISVDEFVKQEAIEKSRHIFVGNLLQETTLPVEKIASLANVTIEVVNEIKAGLIAK